MLKLKYNKFASIQNKSSSTIGCRFDRSLLVNHYVLFADLSDSNANTFFLLLFRAQQMNNAFAWREVMVFNSGWVDSSFLCRKTVFPKGIWNMEDIWRPTLKKNMHLYVCIWRLV